MSGATSRALISRHMRGSTTEQMIRRRDAAGDEMTRLAKIMNQPNPSAEEVTGYIRELLRQGHIPAGEAAQILRSIPHDPTALRGWARRMFAFVMHQGIHAHAAFPRELYPSPQPAPQQAPLQQQAPQPPQATPSG
jgi:hypothetical protein